MDVAAPNTHREARLTLDPAYPGSTIAIVLPSQAHSAFASRRAASREIISEQVIGEDEIAFAKRHLASEASLYFRKANKYPRAFLWRLLEDRSVLEVQSVDLYQNYSPKNQDRKEALLTLALRFSHSIQPFGIAFADYDESDTLVAFVLTTAGELYTLLLQKEFFIRPAATELNISEWCRIYSPSSFGFRYPYRLYACGIHEVWISLHEGSFLQLSRKSGDDGWRETFYTEGGWSSSFRGLIPWKGSSTTRWGNIDLEPSAIVSMEESPDDLHLFTVCLNHTLKSWNRRTGKVGIHMDLLGDDIAEPTTTPQYLIGAAQPSLLQIVDQSGPNGELYYVVTYSPKRHQFKIWAILDADNIEHGVTDLQSEFEMIPPMEDLMNTSIWSLEEFVLKAGSRWRDMQLWIRVRAGTNCVTYKIDLGDIRDIQLLKNQWLNNWTVVDSGGHSTEAYQNHLNSLGDPMLMKNEMQYTSDVEKWLDFLFFPGRFSASTLEAALSVFKRGLENHDRTGTESSKGTLRQRIWTAITSSMIANSHKDDHVAYNHNEFDCTSHWRMYYGIVRDLQKRRSEVLTLAYDPVDDICWLALSDHVSPIRTCSDIEIMTLNAGIVIDLTEAQLSSTVTLPLQDPDYTIPTKLLYVSRELRKGFPETLQYDLWKLVNAEVIQTQSQPLPGRLENFEERLGLIASLSDDEFDRMAELLDDIGGFSSLSNDMFITIVGKLTEGQRGRHDSRDITRYGSRALIRGTQETLNQNIHILLDLLVLTLVLYTEVEPEQLSSNFAPVDIYQLIMASLQEHLVLHWLACTEHHQSDAMPASKSAELGMAPPNPSPNLVPITSNLTVLENIFIGDWSNMLFPTESMSSLITYWCRAWTFGASIREQYDAITCHVMGKLLKHRKYDLAIDFSRFLSQTPWAIYLRGRLGIRLGDYASSAVRLKKVAHGVSSEFFDIEQNDSAGLLDPEEHRYFSDGLENYYQHVISLFETIKAHLYVVEFSQLALLALKASQKENEPAQSHILSRMFSACIQTTRFKEAYSALTRYTNAYLLKSALTTFVATLISHNQASLLLTLPFTNLQSEVDATLLSLANNYNNNYSNKALNPTSNRHPYHKYLAAFRLTHDDFRGAATALYTHLVRLKEANNARKSTFNTKYKSTITSTNYNSNNNNNHNHNNNYNSKNGTMYHDHLLKAYLALINVLASVNPDEAWILAEDYNKNKNKQEDVFPRMSNGNSNSNSADQINGSANLFGGDEGTKYLPLRQQQQQRQQQRKLVTLADIRREYQDELDRVAVIEAGQFPIVDEDFLGDVGDGYEDGYDGDAMDVF